MVVAIAVAGLTTTAAQPATAVPLPPYDIIGTLPQQPGLIIPGPDSTITVGCSEGSRGNDLVTYDSSGTVVRRLARTKLVQGVPNCIEAPAIGTVGMLYGIPRGVKPGQADSSNGPLLAYAGNRLAWTYPASCSNSARSQVAVGTNGNVYVTTMKSNGVHVIGLHSTTGQVILDIPLDTNDCFITLRPYYDGIIVMGQMYGVRYWSYAGKDLEEAPRGSFWDNAFDTSGQMYQAWTVGARRSVTLYNPILGVNSWTYPLPTTYDGGDINISAVMPGGGVAVLATPGSISLSPKGEKGLLLLGASPQGTTHITLPALNSDNLPYGPTYVLADAARHVVVVRMTAVRTGVQSPSTVDAVELTELDNTGRTIDHKLITASSLPNGQPDGIYITEKPVIASGKVVFVQQCTRCDDPSNKLVFVSLAGLGQPYPGYAVATHKAAAQPKPTPGAALGDSFSSAEGVEPFEPDSDTSTSTCHRSSSAYARLLSRSPWSSFSLRMGLANGEKRFAACSGATTVQITSKWGVDKYGRPINPAEAPQIEHLNAKLRSVTITIGGNDVKVVDFGSRCVRSSCTKGTSIYDTTERSIHNDLPGKLTKTYRAILKAAPNANVYVVGYPHVAPLVTPKSTQSRATCPFLYDNGTASNPAPDAGAARSMISLLNATISNTVGKVQSEQPSNKRLRYVEVNGTGSPFVGHSMCDATGSSYFNNVDKAVENVAYALHPNINGHFAYMRILQGEIK